MIKCAALGLMGSMTGGWRHVWVYSYVVYFALDFLMANSLARIMAILGIHDSSEKLHSAGEGRCVLRYRILVAVRARRSPQAPSKSISQSTSRQTLSMHRPFHSSALVH